MVRVSIYTSFMIFLNGGTFILLHGSGEETWPVPHAAIIIDFYCLLYPTTPLTSCTQANENKQDVVLRIL